ncbi:MAG: serine protease [Deltaproteobacteria bacterium]|nr:MAG: serine protease [Deltaproteobacteria bacterium]
MISTWPLLAAALAQTPPPVVGGSATTSAEWPDVVLVDAGASVCTGTLVGPQTVITAAHCGNNIRSVMVGATDYWANPTTSYRVANTYRHPSYRNEGYDITVLDLAEPVTGVTPRAFAIDCAAAEVVDDAPAWVVGYGAITPDGSDDNSALHSASLTIVDADCSDDPYCDDRMEPNGELFAGGGGVDTCFGDSGGPLFLASSRYGNLLVGVTSRVGYEAATNGPSCGPGGIYTRADTLLPWIRSVSRDTLVGPDCGGTDTGGSDTGGSDTGTTDPGSDTGATSDSGTPEDSGSTDDTGNNANDTGGTAGNDDDARNRCGCQASSAPQSALLATLALLFLRRRRRGTP